MNEKFEADRLQPRDVAIEFEKRFSVGSYLGYQGAKFVERFDANSYLTLSVAMDLFDLGSTPEELAAAFRNARARWLVVSFSSDWLFPPEQSRDIVNALIANNAPVSYCNVQSSLRPRRLPAARRPGRLWRDDAGLPRPTRPRAQRPRRRQGRGARPDQHLPPAPARLRPHRRADPAGRQRARPRLRLRHVAGRAAGDQPPPPGRRRAGRAEDPHRHQPRPGCDPGRPEQGPRRLCHRAV